VFALLPYDYDGFIERLRAHGCVAQRTQVAQRADGRSIEVWSVVRSGREATFQIGPGDAPLAPTTVRSVLDRVGLPRGGFDLPSFESRRRR
jgi:hypothetical protein